MRKRSSSGGRRRPAVHITLGRAARLHRMVAILAHSGRRREEIIAQLGIGLRTFYRELELLRRCGIKIRLSKKTYELRSTLSEAEDRLPFPDPQLSFAEMRELADCPGEAARRLAEMLDRVVSHPVVDRPKRGRGRKSK